MSTLDQIAKSYGTDKSSEIHNYCNKYEKYLPFKRYDKLNILEIGVLNGKSLLTWSDYFYRSKILGIDINPECKKYEEKNKNIFVEIGDQTDSDFLIKIKNDYGPFDMILDDGSHINDHVIYSFQILWNGLKSGGTYVIEDVGTSYWEDYGGGYLKQSSTMETFKKLTDDVNFRGLMNFGAPNVHARREDWLIDLSKTTQPFCAVEIESINFLNGIIIINKR